MNEFSLILTLLVMGVVLLLPFLPGILELLFPEDIKPLFLRLEVKDTAYFARLFEVAIEAALPSEARLGFNTEKKGEIGPEKIPYAMADAIDMREKRIKTILISPGPIELPEKKRYLREVYSHRDMRIGRGAHLFAAYARGSLRLDEDVVVQKWIHGGQLLKIGPRGRMIGRVTSDVAIWMDVGNKFHRMKAPLVEFSPSADTKPVRLELIARSRAYFSQPAELQKRRIEPYGVFIGDKEEVFGDLISAGDIRIGREAKIWGSVKSHGSIVVEEDVSVKGSVLAVHSIRLGERCMVDGPIIAERDLIFAPLRPGHARQAGQRDVRAFYRRGGSHRTRNDLRSVFRDRRLSLASALTSLNRLKLKHTAKRFIPLRNRVECSLSSILRADLRRRFKHFDLLGR